MNSRIEVIRRFHTRFCQWGLRSTIPATEYVGGPVPLLLNPQALLYKRVAIFNAINVLFTIIAIVVTSVITDQSRAKE